MNLSDFTSLGMIIPQLSGKEITSVIQELSQSLQHEKRVPDFLPFYHAALNREFLVSSNGEAGMAFPHARLPGLTQLSFAMGRSREPLLWAGISVSSVRVVFLMAVPATESGQYLSLISGLARLAKAESLVGRIHSAESASQIFEILKQVELRTGYHPGPAKLL